MSVYIDIDLVNDSFAFSDSSQAVLVMSSLSYFLSLVSPELRDLFTSNPCFHWLKTKLRLVFVVAGICPCSYLPTVLNNSSSPWTNIISVQLLPVSVFSVFSVFYVTLPKFKLFWCLDYNIGAVNRTSVLLRFMFGFFSYHQLVFIGIFYLISKGRELWKWNSRWYHT